MPSGTFRPKTEEITGRQRNCIIRMLYFSPDIITLINGDEMGCACSTYWSD
jgi:hypothetical protein